MSTYRITKNQLLLFSSWLSKHDLDLSLSMATELKRPGNPAILQLVHNHFCLGLVIAVFVNAFNQNGKQLDLSGHLVWYQFVSILKGFPIVE